MDADTYMAISELKETIRNSSPLALAELMTADASTPRERSLFWGALQMIVDEDRRKKEI